MDELRAELREVEQKRAVLLVERGNIETRTASLDAPDAGLNERLARLNAGIANADEMKRTIEAEIGRQSDAYDRLREAADDRNGVQERDGQQPYRRTRTLTAAEESRDAGLRVVERQQSAGAIDSGAADRLDTVMRKADPNGVGARYIEAVAEDAYNSAFGKILSYGASANLRMTRDEQEAVERVVRADEARAMSVGTTTTGGFAVPFALDPSIILTSAGSANPVRQIARVETIATDTWKGVSSAGVTAGYAAELTEVGDGTPTLAQPTVSTEKGQAFVPFSIEVGQDWGSLQTELARLLEDARDQADATSMLTGDGGDDLGGILNIGGTGGLTTAQRITTAGTAAYAIADAYSLKQAVPARFLPNATWAFNPTTIDTTRDFVPAGSTSRASIFSADETLLLRRPFVEWSTMATALTSGTKLAILGDWSGYLIVDRIGTSIELIPHLFGGSGRPIGARGVYMYWRTGAGVVNANAFRYLETK